MSIETYINNQLLIAMPAMEDPQFSHTVVYICEHTKDGAMGITINKPLDIKLGEVLKQLNIASPLPNINESPVLLGGPVKAEQGFIIHEPTQNWRSTLIASGDIAITTSRDILQAMADGTGPAKSIVSLGYAGWSAGQLEQELAKNFWLNAPVSTSIIFDLPFAERWSAAAALLGVDFSKLSTDIGHA